MTRFDIHVNLGSFPGSKRGKKQRYISPEEMNEYFITHSITHSLVLYNRDEYKLLETLGKLTKTKVYGVQCIMGTKDSPTDITKPLNLDIGKPYVSGIKIASHRGWWTDGKEIWSGIQYTNPLIQKLLKTLPENTIISLHMQGTSNLTNTSNPMFVANMASKFPKLKWVMNHGGDYGPALQVAIPSRKRFIEGPGKPNWHRNVTHRMAILSGLICSERFYNVFIDSSCYTVPKGEYYKDFTQWCVGSDYPFSENFGVNYTSEVKKFLKHSDIPDNNGVYFFDTHIDKIYEDFIRDNFTTKN